MKDCLHLIDQIGLHVWHMQGSRLVRDRFFAHGDTDAFAAWLQPAQARALHTVLVDLPDEGFHIESIPAVIGSDRRALLQRKLSQHFFGTRYASSVSLGREKAGRRDERILFAALTRPALIEPWLDVLHAREAPVRALLAPPLLTPRLLQGLRPETSRGLIIALSPSGIRQIFFDEGKLRFARLSPAPEGDFEQWGDACLREAQKTFQYLSGQRWIPRGSPLPTYVLTGHDTRHLIATMHAALDENADWLELRAISLDALQRRLGIQTGAPDADTRPLWLHLARHAAPSLQLAPETDRRFWRMRQARTAILAIGAVSLFACGLLALKSWVDARELRQQSVQLQSTIAQEQQRYDQLLQSLPELPAPLDTLRSVVDVTESIAAQPGRPRELLRHLSQSLDAFPDIDIVRLDWRFDSSHAPDALAGAATQAGAAAIGDGAQLVIEGSLPEVASADPRSAIERIRAFEADLRRGRELRGVEVQVLSQPFNVESDKTLRSADSVRAPIRPAFSLRITHRPPKVQQP